LKPPSTDSADVIGAEIEVSQRSALRKHSCKPLCPVCSNIIAFEIEVSQRWAVLQHSCKPLCILSFHSTVRQLECGDEAAAVIAASCLKTNCSFGYI
jgi:hypothetical protein